MGGLNGQAGLNHQPTEAIIAVPEPTIKPTTRQSGKPKKKPAAEPKKWFYSNPITGELVEAENKEAAEKASRRGDIKGVIYSAYTIEEARKEHKELMSQRKQG